MFGEHYQEHKNGESIFSVDPRPIKFGVGACRELAYEVKRLEINTVAIFSDVITIELAPGAMASGLNPPAIKHFSRKK